MVLYVWRKVRETFSLWESAYIYTKRAFWMRHDLKRTTVRGQIDKRLERKLSPEPQSPYPCNLKTTVI